MQSLSGNEIRDVFLRFFTDANHRRIESASIIPVGDPSLLFVNAGMAPLKPYFLGAATPPAPDLCNVQPCVRTIDIADVGDRHHLTFFEMLGSWSIDNYLNDRAVELAFELLTAHFRFPVEKLYVTVYEGDPRNGLPPDDRSAAAWERVGIPRDHIVHLGEDNFWSAGDTGPCGPCTEVFYDTGSEHGKQYRPGGEFDTRSRYIEIWNAGVFMEFDRQADGRFEPLRFTSVDTGSGVERMAMVLQGCDSVYETDIFRPLVAAVDVSFDGVDIGERNARIVADHIRAATFILGEGVVPSNEGRGYIPRRLLRKVIAIATRAGMAKLELGELANVVIDHMRDSYPRLGTSRARILELIAREQRDFGRVVRRGMEHLGKLAGGPGFRITGEEAFTLFATHGMPIDLVRDFAAEQGGSVDDEQFARLVEAHRELSRGASDETGPAATMTAVHAEDVHGLTTTFVGYQDLAGSGEVVAVVGSEELRAGQAGFVVFDRTPFYAEGGGQVGDTGQISAADLLARVEDTQKVDGAHVHAVRVEEGVLRPGDRVELVVDVARRRAVMRNHSGTHLLHAALRTVLGDQARQAGSLVAPDRLRFDFHHSRALSEAEIDRVERMVNDEVLANADRRTNVRSYQDAMADGAVAFAGDRYDDEVRVVSFGDFSMELCGGTHVDSTAEVGLFRILGESSVGSGVRRIEAVTGERAVDHTLERDRLLKGLASRLRVSVNQLPRRVDALASGPTTRPRHRVSAASVAGGVHVSPTGHRYLVVHDRQIEPSELAPETKRLGAELDVATVLLLSDAETRSLRIAVHVPERLVPTFDASAILRDVLAVTGGRGGGSPVFAQGGGVASVDQATVIDAAWLALSERAR